MAFRVEHNAEPIPGYRLIERLGGGGFGEVWSAVAPGGMHKAIKFVFGDLSVANEDDQRAKQELKALERVRNVRHPYILTLERYEVIDGQLMIVMELADRSLWDRYKECRTQGLPGIPREELMRYMEECAEALDLMNQQHQLQHLDIKPQNLFLIHNHVKVADFGLVKDMEGSQASVTGGITPVYAAPETFDGKVSRFTDQYSLAIVYQELLTGQRPFNGTNVRQLVMQHISAQPNVTPLPPGDQAAIARALAKEPNDRHATCRDLVTMLRNADAKEARRDAPDGTDTAGPPSSQGVTSPSNARKTDSSLGATQNIRAIENGSLRRPEAGPRVPVETPGPGSLMPAIVIGIGQTGLSMLRRVRETIHANLAPLPQLPHLRFLFLDTDPEVVKAAAVGPGGFAASEVLLAPLNRPSHYLKPRDGRPPLESWLNPKLLYRIPRAQVTTGVRGLGRLAFLDHYRGIARRLQADLEAILDPQALATAARQTRRGMRTNRPRVYIMAGLAGGTGGGMFIDLAYTARALLRRMGYENPDVVGLFLLPAVEAGRPRTLPLGNTYAALSELHHFGSPGSVFKAKYHDREPPVEDAGPPFGRTILLKQADENDAVASREVFDLCGQFLYRDLATPLGKAADLSRVEQPAPPWEARGQYFQTFNLFEMSWPRRAVQREFARELCRRLVERWIGKDAKPFREPVRDWIEQQWALLELGSDNFIHRVQTALLKKLGSPTEAVFSALVKPLEPGSAQGTERHASSPGWLRPRGGEPRGIDAERLADVLRRLEELIGRPEDDHPPESPPQMIGLLREVCDRLAADWSQKLSVLAVKLIEEPKFRLAGAEEAIRQLVAAVEEIIHHHEPLCQELTEKAASAYEPLRALGNPSAKKPNLNAREAFELLHSYPKWRFQSLLLRHLAAAFVGVRGHLSDQLREVNFCRVRLVELARLFEESGDKPPPGQPVRGDESLGRRFFVAGCKDIGEAVRLCLEKIEPEDMLALDVRVEAMLKKNFTALVHVCFDTGNVLKDVRASMAAIAAEFANEYLPSHSAAALFFEQHPDEASAEGEVATFYDEAAPEITAGRDPHGAACVAEHAILSAPDDEEGARFREILGRMAYGAAIESADSPDDLVIYRERVNLALADLEHLASAGRDAYTQMTASDDFTPHTRTDVAFRSP
jgi:serine/threonine protein kinase